MNIKIGWFTPLLLHKYGHDEGPKEWFANKSSETRCPFEYDIQHNSSALQYEAITPRYLRAGYE